MPSEDQLREEIAATARLLGEKGLNRAAAGNVSARFKDRVLITPSGVPHDELTAADIVRMDMDGGHEGPLPPSSEWRMHRDIYAARREAGAVIHTHSDHATALACLGEPLPAFHYMVAVAGGAAVECAPYATFGSEDLSRHMLRALGDRKAALLAHHGLICHGRDLKEALGIAEEIEGLARVYLLARAAGQPTILSDDEMARVAAKFATYGRRRDDG